MVGCGEATALEHTLAPHPSEQHFFPTSQSESVEHRSHSQNRKSGVEGQKPVEDEAVGDAVVGVVSKVTGGTHFWLPQPT